MTYSSGLSSDCNAYNYISTLQNYQVWLENGKYLQGSHELIYYTGNKNIVVWSIFVVLAIYIYIYDVNFGEKKSSLQTYSSKGNINNCNSRAELNINLY